jgi:PDZ domain-containing secreted protein
LYGSFILNDLAPGKFIAGDDGILADGDVGRGFGKDDTGKD